MTGEHIQRNGRQCVVQLQIAAQAFGRERSRVSLIVYEGKKACEPASRALWPDFGLREPKRQALLQCGGAFALEQPAGYASELRGDVIRSGLKISSTCSRGSRTRSTTMSRTGLPVARLSWATRQAFS